MALVPGESSVGGSYGLCPALLSWGVRRRRVEEMRKRFIFFAGCSGDPACCCRGDLVMSLC